MVRSTDRRWGLALSLAALWLSVMTCAAGGQEVDDLWGLGPAQGGLLSFAPDPAVEPGKKQPASPPPADLLEQPKEKAVPAPAEPFDRPSLLAARTPRVRLAGLPNMFGDSFGIGSNIRIPAWSPVWYGCRRYYLLADLPPLGGARRVKVAENNKAMPMDRAFFGYSHFHNTLRSIVPPAGPFSTDRYTIGLEKTFCGGLCSAEVRMPFVSDFFYEEPGMWVSNGHVGNLAVGLKRLLYLSRTTAVAAGLYVDTPTGSDLTGQYGNIQVALRNDAVHVLPYIGFLRSPDDVLFLQGFLQLDIAANSNRVELNQADIGKYTEQNLLYVDLCLGRWLYRDPSAYRFRGVAAVLEYHFTSTLQDADVVGATLFDNWIELRNINNRMDVSNVTAGFHAAIGRTTFRVAGVFPVEDVSDRLFDAEIQFSVNRYF